ncbi:hypothetical protein C7B67_22130, partial [filamentous cyanobacterium Phorm 6]
LVMQIGEALPPLARNGLEARSTKSESARPLVTRLCLVMQIGEALPPLARNGLEARSTKSEFLVEQAPEPVHKRLPHEWCKI